jgi:hypothetical protein
VQNQWFRIKQTSRNHSTARKFGLDGCIQVFIGCSHPVQTWARAIEWITDQFKLGGQTPWLLSLNWSAIHLALQTFVILPKEKTVVWVKQNVNFFQQNGSVIKIEQN